MPRARTALIMLAALAAAFGTAALVAQPPLEGAPAPRQAVAAVAAGQAAPLAVAHPGAWSPRNASYSIDVRLDHASRTLSGRAILTWRNVASVPTSELRFHLYYNAWRNSESTWMREARLRGSSAQAPRPGDWGWMDVSQVRLLTGATEPVDLTGRTRFIAPDDGNPSDRTVLMVPLPAPVAPGDTINVEVAWTSKVPRTFSRTGTIGSYYFLAQWFPKLGVLEDSGWNCHQFHAGTEFYADYGVYDVRMIVPSGWVVGASGQERGRSENADGTTTHAYHADDVHDFAWTTSPDYVERRAAFEHPNLPKVEMRLLLQPEHDTQAERHFEATRTALRYYGEWYGAYPYGYLTIIDPAWQSRSGGMEYPTLFTAGSRWLAPAGVTQPEGVTVHEAGHQFWYGIVGNNEFEHAWMDEGFNTFSTARAIEANPAYRTNYYAQRYFGGFIPWVFRDIVRTREADGNGLAGYRGSAESDVPSTPTYMYYPATGGGLSYSKTALWLHTLERYLGWPMLQRIMSTYFDRWKFRHPQPQDFFTVANEVSGRDLGWYFDQVHRSSNVFDYGVSLVKSEPVAASGFVERDGKIQPAEGATGTPRFRTTVVVRRHGEAVFPTEVLVVFRDGEQVREAWNGRDRWKAFIYEREAQAAYAEVDPSRVLLLDINRVNNSYSTTPKRDEAARKWMLKWLVWLQDALMGAGFFI
ncbi:MAG: M1 family metallopeptidase [Acidobacteriota bacterium]